MSSAPAPFDAATLKERVAKHAVDSYVKSGMKLGLGTGSTALPAIRHVGALLRAGTLRDIKAVPTSFQSHIACEEEGIPLYSLNSPEIGGALDLALDGADEVDPGNRLIKGGGGALLLEKIVAYNSARFIVIVDERKLVERLGPGFAIPVEIVPDARVPVVKALVALGGEVSLREAVRKAGPVVTDRGNLILDTRFPQPVDPCELEAAIAAIAGVVESGLFTRIKPLVCVAHADGRIGEREA